MRRSRNLAESLSFALQGLRFAWGTQRNLRIHLVVAAAVAAAAWWLRVPAPEAALLALAAGAVVGAELLNTAVEAAVDLSSPGWHPRASVAKNAAAAGVLVTAAAAALVGLLVLGPRLAAVVGRVTGW